MVFSTFFVRLFATSDTQQCQTFLYYFKPINWVRFISYVGRAYCRSEFHHVNIHSFSSAHTLLLVCIAPYLHSSKDVGTSFDLLFWWLAWSKINNYNIGFISYPNVLLLLMKRNGIKLNVSSFFIKKIVANAPWNIFLYVHIIVNRVELMLLEVLA